MDWGTAHPVLLAAADPERRWLAVCQAREDTDGDGTVSVRIGTQGEPTGDALTGYFILGGGQGEPIESFVGSDPTGRHVAFVKEGSLWLVDVVTGARTNLSATGADIADDQSSFLSHRAAAFSPDGSRLLYFRGTGENQRIVVRALATGAESIIEPGPGLVWRASFDGTGDQVTVKVVTDDTNKNRKLEWPVHRARAQTMRCPPSISRLPVWEHPGDRPSMRVAPATGGTATDAPHLVVTLRAARVERHADQALLWRLPGGSTRPLAPAKCESRLVHADVERSLVILTCRDPKTGRHRLSVRGLGFEQPLDLEMVTTTSDFWLNGSPRLVPLHAGRAAALFDTESRRLTMLHPGDRVIATEGGRAAILRDNALVLFDAQHGETVLGASMAPFGRVLRAGTRLAALPSLIDLSSGALLGELDPDSLALSRDGKGLFPSGARQDADRPATGPLRWVGVDQPPQPPTPSQNPTDPDDLTGRAEDRKF